MTDPMQPPDRIAPALLRQLLRYEPETGKLFWCERPREMFRCNRSCSTWNARFAGKEAFTADNGEGYRQGAIFGKLHYAHRVIWALHYGAWPSEIFDHRDGDRANNRIENLRDVSANINARNIRMSATNTSGVNGVRWDRERKKWAAFIWRDGRNRYLGRFETIGAAAAARKAAEIGRGFTERHGEPAQ